MNARSVIQFKTMISPAVSPSNFDLNLGTRFCQIIHCRLKLGCSDLNADKYNRHISEISRCSCGQFNEDALHYLFVCRNYHNLRSNMYFYTQGYNLKTVLYGNESLDNRTNNNILRSLHQFISKSNRFL